MLATACHNEFSWLLIDADGAVGVFMVAGTGYVPDALLQLGVQGIKSFNQEVLNALVDAPNPSRSSGEQVWIDGYEDRLCEKGLFVFDWDEAQFQRVRSPKRPVCASDLRSLLAPFAEGIPTAQIRLKDCAFIDVRMIIPCRRKGDVPFG
ncbi:MAG: hypothetical protein AB8H80_12715 [Planctomycetota bacterium]